VTHCFCFKY